MALPWSNIRCRHGLLYTVEEMVDLWKTYCLSVLDQSCVLWGSGLTLENEQDLERTQKTFARLVLQENFTSYNEALEKLGLQNKKKTEKENVNFEVC